MRSVALRDMNEDDQWTTCAKWYGIGALVREIIAQYKSSSHTSRAMNYTRRNVGVALHLIGANDHSTWRPIITDGSRTAHLLSHASATIATASMYHRNNCFSIIDRAAENDHVSCRSKVT